MSDDLITPNDFFISPAEDQAEPDIREAMKKVIAKRKKDPDYVAKQLDGVLPPKPFLSPEHYHISYEYQGRTYPDTGAAFKRPRLAYLEMWRKQSLAAMFGEPEFSEEGPITISTVIKGRTGIHRVTMRVVECFLPECARNPSPLQPLLEPGYGDIRR